jgi:hypothetical protein
MPIIWPPYPSTFQTDVLPDTGVLGLGANGSFAPLAMTLDGFKFERGIEYTDTTFDLMRARVKGLQRITKFDSMLSGKIRQFNDAQIPYLEPGAASASGTGIVATYWAMQAAGAYLAAGSYGADLRFVVKRAPNVAAQGWFQYRFHVWLCTKYDVTWKDKTGAEIDCTFLAMIDPTTTNPATGVNYTINDCPYIIEDIYTTASAL